LQIMKVGFANLPRTEPDLAAPTFTVQSARRRPLLTGDSFLELVGGTAYSAQPSGGMCRCRLRSDRCRDPPRDAAGCRFRAAREWSDTTRPRGRSPIRIFGLVR
jgi:hypothetical protein